MKSPLIIAALILAACASLMTSCAGSKEEQKAQLTQWANVAVNVLAESNPQQAALIRTGGALVIKAVNGEGFKAADASALAVDLAVEKGKLTQAQADQLKAAAVVPLAPESPLPTILPALPAK